MSYTYIYRISMRGSALQPVGNPAKPAYLTPTHMYIHMYVLVHIIHDSLAAIFEARSDETVRYDANTCSKKKKKKKKFNGAAIRTYLFFF